MSHQTFWLVSTGERVVQHNQAEVISPERAFCPAVDTTAQIEPSLAPIIPKKANQKTSIVDFLTAWIISTEDNPVFLGVCVLSLKE